jgi:uncharacterized paraquat-inducible protein A
MRHEGCRHAQKSFRVWATDQRVGVEHCGNACSNCVYYKKSKKKCKGCHNGLYYRNFKKKG